MKSKKAYSVDRDIQRLGYVLPFFVVIMIIGPYVFVIPYIIIPQMDTSSYGMANMAIATSFVCLIFTSYFKSIFTSPGYIPTGWKPDMESGLDVITHDSEIGSMPATRYCQKCNSYKPERAHHCRVCDKCILKMDHHCPWINNCVGHNNHKYFLLFLIYASLGILYLLCLVIMTFIDSLQTKEQGPEDFIAIFGLTIIATIMLPLGLAIIMLLGWQLWLVAENTTSIENEEFEKLKHTSKKEGKTYKQVNVYNLGTLTNYKSVFGPQVLWWWYPTQCQGDGLSFKRDYRSRYARVR